MLNKKDKFMKKRFFLLFLLILVVVCITGCSKKYKLSLEEAVAWTSLRLAIAESTLYDGSTTLTTKHIELLRNVAKQFDKNSEWFNDTDVKYIAYGRTMDTEKYQLTTLCSEYYCAIFKIENDNGTYYLLDYDFLRSTAKGHVLYVTEKSELLN